MYCASFVSNAKKKNNYLHPINAIVKGITRLISSFAGPIARSNGGCNPPSNTSNRSTVHNLVMRDHFLPLQVITITIGRGKQTRPPTAIISVGLSNRSRGQDLDDGDNKKKPSRRRLIISSTAVLFRWWTSGPNFLVLSDLLLSWGFLRPRDTSQKGSYEVR